MTAGVQGSTVSRRKRLVRRLHSWMEGIVHDVAVLLAHPDHMFTVWDSDRYLLYQFYRALPASPEPM